MTTFTKELDIEPLDLLNSRAVFLSASFPSRERSARFFESADPNEITQALVAACRAILSANGRIVFGGHPSVTPLVMMVAEEYLPERLDARKRLRRENQSRVIAYQSEAFRPYLTQATQQLEEWGLGELRWAQSEQDVPKFSTTGTLIPGSGDRSLEVMRRQMLQETKPLAAIFIGGMEGIRTESELFRALCKNRPLYFIGGPGGAARELAGDHVILFSPRSALSADELLTSRTYPSLFQRIVIDIASKV
jgi:SLOG cluster3 family